MPNDLRVASVSKYSTYQSMVHDPNCLYFCEDTQQLFKGDVQYSKPLIIGYDTPDPEQYPPSENCKSLYYDSVNYKLYVSDGNMWILLNISPSIEAIAITNEEIESLFDPTIVNSLYSELDRLV